ncbi:hypothetical protein EGW08_006418, partial [Elysia chlorotica]
YSAFSHATCHLRVATIRIISCPLSVEFCRDKFEPPVSADLTMPSYKLNYFDARGRGEVIRLVFAAAGQEFEDNRVSREDWPALKPKTPFGQMPALEVDGEMIAQTGAICNYLAKEFGLYGKSSKETCLIDQIVCLVNDFFMATVKVMYLEKDEAKKAELMVAFKEEECPKYMGYFESLLKKNGTGFYVGSEVSLADIFVYDLVWNLNSRDPSPFNIDSYPLVKEHQNKIGSLPTIKAYLAARKHTDM